MFTKLKTALEVVAILIGLVALVIFGELVKEHPKSLLPVFIAVIVFVFAIPALRVRIKRRQTMRDLENRYKEKRDETITVQGNLEAYYEQGWEGQFLCAFNPEEPLNLTRPIPLKNGHHLTIYSESNEAIWKGVVYLYRSRGWNHDAQYGVRKNLWKNWFWHSPALRAELVLPPEDLPN